MNYFQKLFRSNFQEGESVRVSSSENTKVDINNTQITITFKNGSINTILWDEVIKVSVITTDQGPIFDDVFLCLFTRNNLFEIPSEAIGYEVLLNDLSTYFKEFDFEEYIKAMSSSDNNEFICWVK